MKTLRLDLETYSPVDIKKSNVYYYAAHPEFLVLMCTWALDDGPVNIALGHDEIRAIPGLWDDSILKVAHNSQFDRVCLSAMQHQDGLLPPLTYLDPLFWDDTASLAAEWGYPRSLEKVAVALGAEEKDSAGTSLIKLFCVPNRKGRRNMPEDFPEEWEAFKKYALQDTATLREVHLLLPDWPNLIERQAWIVDQYINDQGIPIDRVMAEYAVDAAEENKIGQELELFNLSGVVNPGSGPQMKKWLDSVGLNVPNMQAGTVTDLLARGDLDPDVRRVLELKQDLALVASAKYTAALDRLNEDDKLRGAFQFFGAHTGRWAGRGVQLQNLPRATLENDDAVEAAILDLKMGLGGDAYTLKALVRSMFTGPFTVVDYAAIEARVIAWLAGEDWALQAFEAGRDIYVETAAKMGPNYTRSEGKVAVLALGYNGGTNSLVNMGAQGSDAKLQGIVNQWRDANQNIVGFWRQLDTAFRTGGQVGEHIHVEKDGSTRRLWLPSGRAISYHGIKSMWKDNSWGKRVQEVSFINPMGVRTSTYGGKLTENVTQAVARDILNEALIRLHDAGHYVAGHVHDEILVLDQGNSSVETINEIMVQPTSWSAGLPLSGAGFSTYRYKKD